MTSSGGKPTVAHICQQIVLALEAMHREMYSVPPGVARQWFLVKRLEGVSALQDQLADLVGDGVAMDIVCESYVTVMEQVNEQLWQRESKGGLAV